MLQRSANERFTPASMHATYESNLWVAAGSQATRQLATNLQPVGRVNCRVGECLWVHRM